MDPDEDRVGGYLEDRGFTAKRFSKAEARAGKTPDFRVFRNGEFLFYCEVKSSPEDRWLDEHLNNAAPGELVGGLRNDPIFNRLTSDIHGAVKQFDAINKDQKHPNILALVNHDDTCGFNDLLGILTGLETSTPMTGRRIRFIGNSHTAALWTKRRKFIYLFG